MKIPLEFADLVSIEDAGGGNEPPDSHFQNFLQDAELAGSIGWDAVKKFKLEDAKLEQPLSKRYAEFTPRTAAKTPSPSPAPASQDLAKKFLSADSRRRDTLREYLRKSLAGGEKLEEIVSYARRLEPQTAALLQELGTELLRGVA